MSDYMKISNKPPPNTSSLHMRFEKDSYFHLENKYGRVLSSPKKNNKTTVGQMVKNYIGSSFHVSG